MENPFKPTERDWRKILIMFVGAFAAIAVTAWLQSEYGENDNPFLVASFGATAVLVFAVPDGPLSKPKNVFFGHLFSAIVGVATVLAFSALPFGGEGKEWWCIAFAVALAIVVMVLTDTIHPPGGATALTLVFNTYPYGDALFSLSYIVRPIMLGVVIILLIGFVCNRARKYCNEHPLKTE